MFVVERKDATVRIQMRPLKYVAFRYGDEPKEVAHNLYVGRIEVEDDNDPTKVKRVWDTSTAQAWVDPPMAERLTRGVAQSFAPRNKREQRRMQLEREVGVMADVIATRTKEAAMKEAGLTPSEAPELKAKTFTPEVDEMADEDKASGPVEIVPSRGPKKHKKRGVQPINETQLEEPDDVEASIEA